MQFTRERADGIYSVHAVEEQGISVNSPYADDPRDDAGHLWLERSFIITPRHLQTDWPVARLDELQGEHLAALGEMGLEVLLLGTGREMVLPGLDQLAALIGLRVGYEVMGSAAACRTYNVLAAEGRQVAAAIVVD